MSKYIPEFDELSGPAGRALTEYVAENIPALWLAVPEVIADVGNTGAYYTGTIPDWGPQAPISYYPPNKLLWLTPHVTNLASPQISISGLPPIVIVQSDGITLLPAGELSPGVTYLLRVTSGGNALSRLP